MAATPRKSAQNDENEPRTAEAQPGARETTVEPTPVRERVLAHEPQKDRIAMVSRDKNGNPDQSADYEIVVPDEEKDRAENRPEDNRVDGA